MDRDDGDIDRFYLPVPVLNLYDDPGRSLGDEGWDLARLRDDVVRRGGILEPVAVGMSMHDLDASGDRSVNAYNGNHRLWVARELGYAEILCENSDADDAVPLSRAEVEALGGRVVEVSAPRP